MELPEVDVVIPTMQERSDLLLPLLATLLCQTHEKWSLILCSDPREEDATSKFLNSVEAMGHKVTIIDDKHREGPGKALQQLLEASHTRYMLRVDDDVILTNSVLEKLLSSFLNMGPDVAAIACPANGFGNKLVNYVNYWTKTENKAHLWGNGRIETMNDNFVHHSANQDQEIMAETDFLSGYCMMVDREKLFEVGGYAPPGAPHHHREDWFATLRLREKGYRLLVRGDAVAFHCHHRDDFSDRYRASRSEEDKALFENYRLTVSLPRDRRIGLVVD